MHSHLDSQARMADIIQRKGGGGREGGRKDMNKSLREG